MDIEQLNSAIRQTIMEKYEPKLHKIGSVLRGEASKQSLAPSGQGKYIFYRGDFVHSLDYQVELLPQKLTLTVQSGVQHAPYVLGGKVASWTPLQPLIEWVEYKRLSWTDKESGAQLSPTQMAWMIRSKIRREGIPERNVWQGVVKEKEGWIRDELDK